jgi:UDP-2,3-diacylglucosamine pyrophosphatase LpxH
VNAEAPIFDELYVVSDLHLGAAPGHQIFGQGVRLAAAIRRVAQATTGTSRAFVVNGDFVDFLAEEPSEYFDAAGAVRKLARIIADASFSPVFLALRQLLKSPSCHLVMVLGNHDVELALPHVQHWLGNWLSEGVDDRLGRLHFATDGAGYRCQVGNKRVLCIHGNEFDDWNVIDHRALLQFIRAWNRGQSLPEWTPNGGTRLVIDVMNTAKRKHAMVDLLKPETKAAVPLVLAFSPELLAQAGAALRAVSVRTYDGLRMTAGFLGGESSPEERRPSEAEALMATLSAVEPPRRAASGRAIQGVPAEFREAQQRIELKQPALLGYDPNAPVETLGLREWWNERSQPTLRAALRRWLANDKTFEVATQDDTFRAVDEAIGSGVEYVFAGHTHLRRALPRRWPGCAYFNTGTWIRLMRLDKSLLESETAFETVVDALRGRSIAELDQTQLHGAAVVHHISTVGSVQVHDGHVVARLNDAQDDGGLVPVPGTEFS